MAAHTWSGGKGKTAKAEEKMEGKVQGKREEEQESWLLTEPWKHSFILLVSGGTLALNTIFCIIWTLIICII